MTPNKNRTGRTRKKHSTKTKAASHGGRMFELFIPILFKLWSGLTARLKNGRGRVVSGLLLIALSLWLVIATLSHVRTGFADQSLTESLRHGLEQQEPAQNLLASLGAKASSWLFGDLLGWGVFFLLAFLLYAGIFLVWRRHKGVLHLVGVFITLGFSSIWVSIFMACMQGFISPDSELLWGGAHGKDLTDQGIRLIGGWGLILALATTLIIATIMISDRVLHSLKHPKVPNTISIPSLQSTKEHTQGMKQWLRSIFLSKPSEDNEDSKDLDENEDNCQVSNGSTLEIETSPLRTTEQTLEPQSEASRGQLERTEELNLRQATYIGTEQNTDELIIEDTRVDDLVDVLSSRPEGLSPGLQLFHYEKPSIDLLRDYEQGAKGQNKEEIELNKQRIIDTLSSFKTPVKPYKATIGPTVTLYEVIPEQGIKVARIKTMEDDIALSLKSEGIRIIAPMPGKGTVGIEVPNSTPQTVSMRTILASRRYNDLLNSMQLPVGIGKTITNEPFVFDLAKMPHLLIAGATGQGKSVGLNAMITSLLYSKRPEELKFVLVDPKMLEFSIYAPLERHFMAKLPDLEDAIITDMSKVVPTLHSLCIEMDNRYKLLTQARVRNILEYNDQVRSGVNVALNKGNLMPYIVLIVDEFADLIMTSGKEVEQPIARLAQKARAAGIHMVIATQRPSTDVITGLIKANFPARIAFKVFSMVDSRTILDSPGANQLIGRGDMLFYQGKDMIRIQCAFLDTPETEQIVSHICKQEGPASAYELPEYIAESETETRSFNPREKDPLFEEVARLVVSSGVGSTSNIQRKFNLGYNRAGRLMDQLEGAGIVSGQDGSKPREVFIKDLISLEQLLDSLR